MVIVVGAGPTGLMLACELRLAGVDVLVLERDTERSPESKASGLHVRTMEVFEQRGMLDELLAAGHAGPYAHFAGLPLDITGLETRHPYVLGIQQSTVEPVLEKRALELGAQVRRGMEVVDLRQDEAGVEVRAGEEWLRADYVVGCDGGRSAVRGLAGIDFPGTAPTLSAMHGDVELSDPPAGRIFGQDGRRENGSFLVAEIEPGVYRVMTVEFDTVADRDAPVTLDALREACFRIAGTDFGMRGARWVARFADATRQAVRYRSGRVLVAGDAAHIHFVSGGQGLNLGVQDAVNLGWKLAAVVTGQASRELLDSYHAERYPVAERVLLNTRAQTALMRPGAQTDALRQLFGELLGIGEVTAYLGGMATQLDIRYPLGEGHPLLGRRFPDYDLGGTRVFELLRAARPVLIDFTDSAELCAAVEGAVEVVRSRPVADLSAVLVRPDGHVAWVAAGEPDLGALRTVLASWFSGRF